MLKSKLIFFLPSCRCIILKSYSPKVLQSFSLTLLLSLSLLVSQGQQWGEYTFYSIQNSTSAHLIDTNGTTYHTWSFSSSAKTGYSSYLEPGGSIVRTVARQGNSFNGGGICGQVQKVDWNGTILWNYVCSTTQYCSHHDIHPMPNGNVLLIVYELKSSTEVEQAGCAWAHTMWPDMILEVQPSGTNSGNIVWEWHAWDHLVQDHDPSKDNYGVVADHPELLDLNYNNGPQVRDWMHVNGIDYNEELEQIVISSHFLNELYVIDHSTTTEEAAGHTGGNSGKGGDILYRWGNPAAYDASGTNIFHVVHDAHWIPAGSHRANSLVGFNNNGISNNQSSVDVFTPPYDGFNYTYSSGSAYEPSTYEFRHACSGHTHSEGGCQNLPNGNILVCITQAGFIYEVDSNNTLLWSKNLSGGPSNARRYTRCYIENTVPPDPAITLQNDTLFSSPGTTYRWFFDSTLISGAMEAFLVPEQNGSYQVAVTDDSGCESGLSDPFYYELTGIAEINGKNRLPVYPVPTKGIINISDEIPLKYLKEINIFDQSGRSCLQASGTRTLDLSFLESGIYVMVACGEGQSVRSAKIILIK